MSALFRYHPPQIQVAKTKGSYIWDIQSGKKYLDFLMGYCVGNAGWNNPELLKAIKRFKGPAYVMPSYGYGPWEKLASTLTALMPTSNYSCFRATGGTEAVEIALKASRAYNHRKKFIAFNDAYHGQSFAAMALVGLHEDKFGPYEKNYVRLETDDWEKTTNQAVLAIQKGDVCAFISEPVICNLGVVVPPQSFFKEVRNACTKTDTVFIMDEVMTGFGRTGKWFGFEHFDVKPDIVTIAKGFSSGHGALGAAIIQNEVAQAMNFDFSNYSTFGWHPLAVEATLANLNFIKKQKLVQKSGQDGKYLSKRLSEFADPQGFGLCVGFEAPEDLSEKCFKKGLITESYDGRQMLFPPLTVTRTEIDSAVNIIQSAFS